MVYPEKTLNVEGIGEITKDNVTDETVERILKRNARWSKYFVSVKEPEKGKKTGKPARSSGSTEKASVEKASDKTEK